MRPGRQCVCWFSLNTGPNYECEKCGLPRNPNPVPTAEDLALIAAQCSETEWLCLVRNGKFLTAACEDFATAAAAARELLGRDFIATPVPKHASY